MVNSVIGTGVFALPGTVAARLGWWSLLALVVAATIAVAIVLSFAEVASRFDAAGGPYLYAQAGFGRFVGLQMGWMAYFVRVLSAAVQLNLVTTYMVEFWPQANDPVGRAFIGALFLGFFTAVNIRGVKAGSRVSDVFAILKITPLILLGAAGLAWLARGMVAVPAEPVIHSVDQWLAVLLLLMFSYGGFEAITIPLGESKDPQRDAPFALLTGIGTVVLIYLLVQVAVLVALPDPDVTERPLAEVARVFLGNPGAAFMTVLALVSVTGWWSSGMLAVPRLTYAMAERGDLPAVFGRIHARWRTPWVSILLFAGLTYVLSLQGGLLSNISLSTVSRLLTYGLICALLPVFRWRDRTSRRGVEMDARFRVPVGLLVAGIGIGGSLLLAARMTLREGIWLLVIVAIAAIHWAIQQRHPPRASS